MHLRTLKTRMRVLTSASRMPCAAGGFGGGGMAALAALSFAVDDGPAFAGTSAAPVAEGFRNGRGLGGMIEVLRGEDSGMDRRPSPSRLSTLVHSLCVPRLLGLPFEKHAATALFLVDAAETHCLLSSTMVQLDNKSFVAPATNRAEEPEHGDAPVACVRRLLHSGSAS
jgi:hypothetical protein